MNPAEPAEQPSDTPKRAVALRPAAPTDAAALARLSTELGYPANPAQIRERLAGLEDPRRHMILVASADGEIRGWIHVERRLLMESGEYAEIMGLVVASVARRSGLGRRLVEAAESWAAERGLSPIRVRSNAARSESHPFYRALGYERIKTQQVYEKPLGPGTRCAAGPSGARMRRSGGTG